MSVMQAPAKPVCRVCGIGVERAPKPPLKPICIDCATKAAPPPPPPFIPDLNADVDVLCAKVGVPPRYANLDAVKAVAGETCPSILRSFVGAIGAPNRVPRAVLLLGATGRGKTTAAMAAVREAVTKRRVSARDVMVTTEHRLLVPTAEQRYDRPDLRRVLDGVKLLVVDELGRGEWPPFLDAGQARIDLFNVIVGRDIATIFTTNLEASELQRKLGDAAALSRLVDLIGGSLKMSQGVAKGDLRERLGLATQPVR